MRKFSSETTPPDWQVFRQECGTKPQNFVQEADVELKGVDLWEQTRHEESHFDKKQSETKVFSDSQPCCLPSHRRRSQRAHTAHSAWSWLGWIKRVQLVSPWLMSLWPVFVSLASSFISNGSRYIKAVTQSSLWFVCDRLQEKLSQRLNHGVAALHKHRAIRLNIVSIFLVFSLKETTVGWVFLPGIPTVGKTRTIKDRDQTVIFRNQCYERASTLSRCARSKRRFSAAFVSFPNFIVSKDKVGLYCFFGSEQWQDKGK